MQIIKAVTALAIGVFAAGAATAQDYPSKPITLVIPFAAGGSTETMARVFSEALGEELGQKVIVKVRPGAGMPSTEARGPPSSGPSPGGGPTSGSCAAGGGSAAASGPPPIISTGGSDGSGDLVRILTTPEHFKLLI